MLHWDELAACNAAGKLRTDFDNCYSKLNATDDPSVYEKIGFHGERSTGVIDAYKKFCQMIVVHDSLTEDDKSLQAFINVNTPVLWAVSDSSVLANEMCDKDVLPHCCYRWKNASLSTRVRRIAVRRVCCVEPCGVCWQRCETL